MSVVSWIDPKHQFSWPTECGTDLWASWLLILPVFGLWPLQASSTSWGEQRRRFKLCSQPQSCFGHLFHQETWQQPSLSCEKHTGDRELVDSHGRSELWYLSNCQTYYQPHHMLDHTIWMGLTYGCREIFSARALLVMPQLQSIRATKSSWIWLSSGVTYRIFVLLGAYRL